MYKSPIELKIDNIVSEVSKQVDEYTLRCFQQIGVNVDKDELIKALKYDREQYAKGWNDRDSEIVRCKDCCHCIHNEFLDTYCCWKFSWGIPVEKDGFCSWGERKEDGKRDNS